jgi:hypothetical protein
MNILRLSFFRHLRRALLMLAACALVAACVGPILSKPTEWVYFDMDALLAARKLPFREANALEEVSEKAVDVRLKICLQQNQFSRMPDKQDELVKLDTCMKPFARVNRWGCNGC